MARLIRAAAFTTFGFASRVSVSRIRTGLNAHGVISDFTGAILFIGHVGVFLRPPLRKSQAGLAGVGFLYRCRLEKTTGRIPSRSAYGFPSPT